jgi:hypothetical protein
MSDRPFTSLTPVLGDAAFFQILNEGVDHWAAISVIDQDVS